jgi:hypothetical protein
MREPRFLRHLILAAIEEFPHIPVVHAPGPWHVAGGVPAIDPARFQLGDDGRFALGEDGKTPAILRLQRRSHPAYGRNGACLRRLGRGRAWAAWAHSRPAWRAKKTVSAQKGVLDHSASC